MLLPLFPLQSVLFPRTPLPLHIFEPRYREMIGEAIEARTEFGVVLAGSQGLANLGCSALVDRVVERHEDGRFDVETSGRRRFEIQSLNEDRAFLRGRVEFFDDDEEDAEDPAGAGADRQPTIARWKSVWHELSRVAGVESEPRWDDRQLSFQLAGAIPDLAFRQSLLGMRSEARRMREIAGFFPQYLNEQKHIHHVQAVAPRNGHGKKKIEEL
jgi:Lon protease-like protein